MSRLFGIETEYGIAVEGQPDTDPVQQSVELIKSYRSDDFRPMWDYRGEDPFRDERGFRAEVLHEHPDEKAYQEQDQQRSESFVEIKGARILTSGARLYNDHAQPEYSTPECQNLFELVAHDKAGERILRQCAERRRESSGQQVELYKNNTDFSGHSYGCHDNYLMQRQVPFDYLKESLLPFLVTRQIYAGAGKIGIESESGMESFGCFQLAQRSDFFHVEVSVDTMHRRPIFNTRDEPHADPAKYRRLHGIAGDANMSEYATALKIGTTALVIDLIERRLIPERFAIADPIQTIKDISRDQTYKWEFKLRNCLTTSAVDMQSEYLNLAQKHLDPSIGQNDWILAEWEATLSQLQAEPMELSDRLDWVAKRWLLETFAEEEGVELDDPWLQSLDLAYHNIDPEISLYYGLEAQGIMRRLVTDQQIEYAIHNPPADTRAYFRGTVLNRFGNYVESIQWDHITLKSNQRAKVPAGENSLPSSRRIVNNPGTSANNLSTINMNDMADTETANQYNRHLDQSETVEELIAGANEISEVNRPST